MTLVQVEFWVEFMGGDCNIMSPGDISFMFMALLSLSLLFTWHYTCTCICTRCCRQPPSSLRCKYKRHGAQYAQRSSDSAQLEARWTRSVGVLTEIEELVLEICHVSLRALDCPERRLLWRKRPADQRWLGVLAPVGDDGRPVWRTACLT